MELELTGHQVAQYKINTFLPRAWVLHFHNTAEQRAASIPRPAAMVGEQPQRDKLTSTRGHGNPHAAPTVAVEEGHASIQGAFKTHGAVTSMGRNDKLLHGPFLLYRKCQHLVLTPL